MHKFKLRERDREKKRECGRESARERERGRERRREIEKGEIFVQTWWAFMYMYNTLSNIISSVHVCVYDNGGLTEIRTKVCVLELTRVSVNLRHNYRRSWETYIPANTTSVFCKISSRCTTLDR